MTHSEKATALVIEFEGFSAVAYEDGGGRWTIGYGHAEGVQPNDTCTKLEAVAWLDADLVVADDAIASLVTVPINQNQWDALTSFVYNIGQGNFSVSTVHVRINGGDMQGAADAMLWWNKVDGHVSAGLIRRRTAERRLFLEAM